MQLFDRLRRHPAYWYVVGIGWAVVALLLFLETGYLRKNYAYGSPGTDDFIEYWTAGQLLRQGENPYDFRKLYALQQDLGSPHDFPIIMWNPPWLLVWIYPVLWLPFLTSAVVWIAINGLLILLGASLIWKAFCPLGGKPLGIAWIAASVFIPSLLTLRMGQMSSLILVGLAGFLYFVSRGSDFAAGMCLSLATIKPHVAYLFWIALAVWIVLERRWMVVAGGAALMLSTLGLLTLLWPNWIAGYRAAMAQPPLYWGTASMGGILRQLVFTDTPQAQFLPPILGVAGFVAFWLLRRPPVRWKTDLAPLLLISVPTAAYGWAFDQVILLIPYLAIILWLLEEGFLSLKQKLVALAGLVLLAAGMVVQNLNAVPDVYFFWCPWALGAVYLYVWRIRRPIATWDPSLFQTSHRPAPI